MGVEGRGVYLGSLTLLSSFLDLSMASVTGEEQWTPGDWPGEIGIPSLCLPIYSPAQVCSSKCHQLATPVSPGGLLKMLNFDSHLLRPELEFAF